MGSPADLHEIDSLSARLYDEHGINAQALLGLKDTKTTSLCLDSRGTEWISVG